MKRISVAQFRAEMLTSTEPLEVARYKVILGYWTPGRFGEPRPAAVAGEEGQQVEDWSLETFKPGSKLARLAARNEELAEKVKTLKRQLADRKPSIPDREQGHFAVDEDRVVQTKPLPDADFRHEDDLFATLDRYAPVAGSFNSRPFTPVPKTGEGKKKRGRGKPEPKVEDEE